MDYLKPNPALYNVPWTTEEFRGMPFRQLGKSGLRVSNAGLGLWKIGYPETGDGSRTDEKTAHEIMDAALEEGVTFWDTANRYNNASGNSERIIGNWLRNNAGERRNITLCTKLFGGMDGISPNHCRLSRGSILDSVYASLSRMQVDVLYFHAYDDITPVEESLDTLTDLVSRDLVRYFAVSNFTVSNIREYLAIANDYSSRCRILAVQNQFDIVNGEPAAYEGVLKLAAESGISFVAWSPLARGLLTEKYLDTGKVGKGDRLFDEGTLEKDTEEKQYRKVRKLAELAHTWDLKLNELVLAYMLTISGMGPVIPAASSVEQLESNAKGAKTILSSEQRAKVQSILNENSA